MLATVAVAFILMALTVTVHAVGLVALLRALSRKHARPLTRFWPMTLLLIDMTCPSSSGQWFLEGWLFMIRSGIPDHSKR